MRRTFDSKFKARVAIEAILDLYSRKVLAWRLSNRPTLTFVWRH